MRIAPENRRHHDGASPNYNTDPDLTNITETSDAASAYPTPFAQTATYNGLNQLTNLSGHTLTWDADGNVLSDGQRNYSWDAENRLIGITYPGKQTAFAYNGFSQRAAITSTPAGGSAVTTSYIWCGARPCQARNASNAVTREYFAEGEYVPPGAIEKPSYYYGLDQIGSVCRAFESGTSAPAYDYDPYGRALQSTAPVTDFMYAGMFYNADSGLYLTQFRAYDPVAGRWLSRDPLGETTDASGNICTYVSGNPLTSTDINGNQTAQVIVGIGIVLFENAIQYWQNSHPSEPPPPGPPPPPSNVCLMNSPPQYPYIPNPPITPQGPYIQNAQAPTPNYTPVETELPEWPQ